MPDLMTVLDGVRAKVAALSLSYGATTIPVVTRKIHQREKSDPAILITVSRGEPETVKPFTNRHDLFTFFALVTLTAPNNNDQSTTLPNLTAWREAIVTLFKRKTDVWIDGLRLVRARPKDNLPGATITKGWDHLAVEVEIQIVEVAV